ncbi:MAG: hypothetical protein AB1451_15560 [Nitrospirota bacterium]
MRTEQKAWARWMRVTVATAVLGSLPVAADAAPIGVPAATTGAGKTALGGEVNVVIDRDLSSGNGEAESSQIFAKGSIGVDERLDVDFRIGFGDFGIDAPGGNTDADLGPAFGAGMRITWASIPEANLKIGSVFQTMRIRAENETSGARMSWTEYDAALGAAVDLSGPTDPKQRATQFGLVPYGGLAWSGLDLSGNPAEDDAFGVFLGLGAKAQGNVQFGAEIRLVDQTALSVGASMAF